MLLTFKAKPLSNNKMIRQFSGRIIKSKEYREFEKLIGQLMLGYNKEIKKFMDIWSKVESCLDVHYVIYMPTYFKADGTINLKGGDVANFEKCLTDSIFKSIGIDDAYIRSVSLTKVPAKEWMISCEILISHHSILGEPHQAS